MRLVIKKESLRRLLRWTQRTLLACAVMLLSYCGFVLVDAWMFQEKESRQLEQLLSSRAMPSEPRASASGPPASAQSPLTVTPGLIGRIEIPRLGVSAIVVEGTSSKTLRRAVGHIRGTSLPGEVGNVGISGHRDTFFRPLKDIQRNDIITLTTLLGEYRYRVVSTKIVDPYAVAVLDPGGTEILTLVTCYPFYFVGASPDRFIVRAERII